MYLSLSSEILSIILRTKNNPSLPFLAVLQKKNSIFCVQFQTNKVPFLKSTYWSGVIEPYFTV